MIKSINDRLIDDWRRLALRFWSVRIALFWGAFSGVTYIWPAFAEMFSVPVFAVLTMVVFAILAVARVTKQPGLY